MKTLHFKVEKVSTDGVTGHLTIHARIVEREDGNETPGAPETHGIDPIALDLLHGGDGEKWRESVKAKMLENHQRRAKAYAQAQEWEGREWPIENP